MKVSLIELSKYIFAKIFGKPNSNCGVGEKKEYYDVALSRIESTTAWRIE